MESHLKRLNSAEKFCVLLLDDDICLTTIVTKALRSALPNADVLVARSIAEAQLLFSEFKINFFILDINLPDGTGIDFLCDVQTLYPNAQVVMITASPVLEYRERSKELRRTAVSAKTDGSQGNRQVRPHAL